MLLDPSVAGSLVLSREALGDLQDGRRAAPPPARCASRSGHHLGACRSREAAVAIFGIACSNSMKPEATEGDHAISRDDCASFVAVLAQGCDADGHRARSLAPRATGRSAGSNFLGRRALPRACSGLVQRRAPQATAVVALSDVPL